MANGVEGGAAAGQRRRRVAVAAAGLLGVLALGAGATFAAPSIVAAFGAGETAAAETAAAPALPDVLPAEPRPAGPASAGDYRIVLVGDGEAFLATASNLIRVKVGSHVAGLGEIVSIVPSPTGGAVTGSLATLRTT
ncbi:hypothetical protein [Aureimonas sp. SK2]|uniref:hypothetical protein n=1 Tax=Aureimonas sp. SK2 TaxID=3015992 RepID=UPI0024443038|nr:hypothetical protein [Aureimonas sp. SK2]